MKLFEAFRMAIHSLSSHKVRTLLTLMGVVIGIASVVTMVIFGTSLKSNVVAALGGGASRGMTIDIVGEEEESMFAAAGATGGVTVRAFSERDVARLSELPSVEGAAPVVTLSATLVERGSDQVLLQKMVGTGPGHPVLLRDLSEGRIFDPNRYEAVVGANVRTAGGENVSLGDMISITLSRDRVLRVEVVGRLAPVEGLDPFSSNGIMYLPVSPFYHSTRPSPVTGEPTRVFSELALVAQRVDLVDQAKEDALAYLESDESDAAQFLPEGHTFRILTDREFAKTISGVFDQITLFVAAIAVVSLLVGSIGIANIMLVSVAERKRSIGVMKALGARNGHILRIFLVEAVLLGLVGGALGLIVGVASGAGLTLWLLEGAVIHYPLVWFVSAIAVGALVGLGSGLLPAWRATRVDPIKAIYE